jgi:hypothetical protein
MSENSEAKTKPGAAMIDLQDPAATMSRLKEEEKVVLYQALQSYIKESNTLEIMLKDHMLAEEEGEEDIKRTSH